MADIFETTQNSVKEFSDELIVLLRKSIKEILLDLRRNDNSALKEKRIPSKRNKTLATIGVGAIAVGGIGLVFEAAWAKWILLAGCGGVGIDYFVLRPKSSQHKENHSASVQNENLPMSVRYNVIKRLTIISDRICSMWGNRLNEIKDSLLEHVENSSISDDNKVKVNYSLYVVNKISYSLDNWVSRFEEAENFGFMKELISEYAVYFTGQIEDAFGKQMSAYRNAQSVFI